MKWALWHSCHRSIPAECRRVNTPPKDQHIQPETPSSIQFVAPNLWCTVCRRHAISVYARCPYPSMFCLWAPTARIAYRHWAFVSIYCGPVVLSRLYLSRPVQWFFRRVLMFLHLGFQAFKWRKYTHYNFCNLTVFYMHYLHFCLVGYRKRVKKFLLIKVGSPHLPPVYTLRSL